MRITPAPIISVAAAIAFAGCSALDPYSTLAPTAQPGEADQGPRVAVCYDTLVSSLDEVQAVAQQECAPETVATPLRTDWYMQYCPLLLPARAIFACSHRK